MLDGSAIRQAREAKGMTQAELAAAVGIAQQTIGKIETGIVERTGYEREIAEALGLAPGPVSPLQVLRTILCANPTAEQVLAALNANGLAIVPASQAVCLHDAKAAPIEPVSIIHEICERRGLTPTELARKVGLSPSSINRNVYKNGGYTGTMGVRTLNKIIEWDRSGTTATERDAIDDPVGYIRDVLARHNLTPGALALKVKISGSTLTRALNDPDHKFVLSTRTLQKIKEWDNAQ
jgi:transcriptional regulator with XRE-family HTH domain